MPPQGLRSGGVDRLVGHDPEPVEPLPRQPVRERRESDERGQRED